MAEQTLTANRRSFIGRGGAFVAVAAAAAAVSIPTAAVANGSSSTAWDVAMKRHLAADAACETYGCGTYDPAITREKAGLEGLLGKDAIFLVPDHMGDELERLAEASWSSGEALMLMPAPNRAALRWKLDKVMHIDNEYTSGWSEGYIGQTIADYRRLLGDA